MKAKIRILFVEDSIDDFDLASRGLRDSGLDFEALRVETEDALIKALQEFTPDLMISDYTLPTMGEIEALEITRKLRPQVPLIFLSGTMGEERAIEAIKSGATDYVLKDRPARLAVAVRRALDESAQRSERERLEDALRQAQKMEAIGRLAGGIAHDFNNVLTVINSYCNMVLMDLRQDSPHFQHLQEVIKTADRAASLVSQLMAFSRKQKIQPTALDLNLVIQGMEGMLKRLIPTSIKLTTRLDPSLGFTQADPQQIEQILMNLVVNARDAMPRGGKVAIETQNVDLDEDYVASHPAVNLGPYVALLVSDTGVGMDAPTAAQIFEPYFTTKEAGKGTGLGLATVYGIVKQNQGYIYVESELGQGTTLKIYLPRMVEASVSATDKAPKSLVIEDDVNAVDAFRQTLEKAGYSDTDPRCQDADERGER